MARCTGCSCRTNATPPKVTTYIAEAGKTVDRDGTSYLQLSKGVLLRPQSATDSAMVTFDDYTIDLSQFVHAVSTMKRPRERTTAQLMAPDAKDRADPALLWPYPQRTPRPSGESALRLCRRSHCFCRAWRGANNPSGTRRSRSPAPFSRSPACACSGSQRRPSPSAHSPPPFSSGRSRSRPALALWR